MDMLKYSKILESGLCLCYVISILCNSYSQAYDCTCDKHILCLFKKDTPGPLCPGFISNGFTAEQKESIIETINKLRSRVATGRETLGGGQPSAADMLEVTWDDFLMKTSQRWADQCMYKHTDTGCRISDDNEYFGENLAIYTYPSESMYNEDKYLHLIKSWYDEVKDFSPELVDRYDPTGKDIGHYAQLMNGLTYRVGCGQTRYRGTTYLVCHFKKGVFMFKPLYRKGSPASMCPSGNIISKYEGLCALEKYSTASMISQSKYLLLFLFTLYHSLSILY